MKIFQVIIVLMIALLADAVTGFGATVSQADIQQFEQGTDKCTITLPPPSSTCTSAVTFPKPFASVPNHVWVTWAGFNVASNHAETTVRIGELYFQSDAGETWANMPAAETEIYGNTNHETSLNAIGASSALSSLSLVFFATCIQGSTSSNATLRPEYEDSIGGPWHELAATHTALDIGIGSGLLCGPGLLGTISLNSAGSTLAGGFTAGEQMRIAGISGAGAGDTVILNNLYLVVTSSSLQTPSICVPSSVVCPNAAGPPTKTGLTWGATIAWQPTSGYEIDIRWSAYLCINGGAAC